MLSEINRRKIELLDRGRELEAKDACKQLKNIIRIGTAFYPYKENFRLYKKRIDLYHSDHKNSSNNTIVRRRFQRHIIREMSNVMYSARVLVVKYMLEEDYENGFHCFMKEMRNFITHDNHINLISRVKMNKYGKSAFETIPKKEIEDYLEKRIILNPKLRGLKKAKEFLDNHAEIRLNELIDRYHKEIMKLYDQVLFKAINDNKDMLKSFIVESQNIQTEALKMDFILEYPVIGAKLRYVNCLIKSDDSK